MPIWYNLVIKKVAPLHFLTLSFPQRKLNDSLLAPSDVVSLLFDTTEDSTAVCSVCSDSSIANFTSFRPIVSTASLERKVQVSLSASPRGFPPPFLLGFFCSFPFRQLQ